MVSVIDVSKIIPEFPVVIVVISIAIGIMLYLTRFRRWFRIYEQIYKI